MQELIQVAKSVLNNNLHLKENEHILIVTDSELVDIAKIFFQAGEELGNETIMMLMTPRSKSGEEPPFHVSEVMRSVEVVLCITKHSLTHTKARKLASASGARIATMPGITIDMLQKGAITADYIEVEKLTECYSKLLDAGSAVVIKKENTHLSFSIQGRESIRSTGIFREKGESGNLPSGESYIAPIEDSANGTILVDGTIAGIGVLSEPITLTIENGRLMEASGTDGMKLLELLGDGKGRNIAEFGIGTNKSARLTGNLLEDEKVFGTVHIAFGSNKSFGGENEAGVHIDCVINEPSVWIDEKPLLLK
ncbi:aminopeptidase [Bacillus sp. DTU_2020_1000418_1_SI_GHA_SEK_038]|uniref:aminopeptidase n=1 Tax=Bacillus sp. DTU_2020_1000418_1_SI_GHA_SEK_038 TaxID=3077585 RepID=UPI0028E2A334|nr:aminopeptidase [Bacillus sp. DTU_2020_1000418_1_SI_GHA_SEK_038]WNS76590.1 aminopeptidase [Bacillus sp. DTU_2020_1000418_1_SI_GHA_SEK_038]